MEGPAKDSVEIVRGVAPEGEEGHGRSEVGVAVVDSEAARESLRDEVEATEGIVMCSSISSITTYTLVHSVHVLVVDCWTLYSLRRVLVQS